MNTIDLTSKVVAFKSVFEAEMIQLRSIANIEMTRIPYKSFDDYLAETFAYQLKAYIYKRIKEKRSIECIFERPSFLDWLLRRKRKLTKEIIISDILKNPPSELKQYFEIVEFEEDLK
jgi:hypothetical protein